MNENKISLTEAFELSEKQYQKLYRKHINPGLLSIYKILGFSSMDIESANGLEICLKDGKKVLDFTSGIGVLALGHNHPRIIDAEKLCHQTNNIDVQKFGINRLQSVLAHNISAVLPDPLDTSFFTVSGAEAIEAGIKLISRAQPDYKKYYITFRDDYHGKTHGALSFTDSENFEIADENYKIPTTDILQKKAEEIYKVALLNRNDIKLAKTNLDIAIKDQQISKSSALPSIGGYYSYNSRVIIDSPISLNNQFDLNAGESIGLQINIPILNGLTTRTNIKKSQLNVLRVRNFLDQTKLDLENTINQSLNDAQGALKAYQAAKKTKLARETAYNYAKERFENGALNTINFLQAQQLFEASQSDLIKAKYDYIFKIKVLEFYFGVPNLYL